MVVVMVAVMVRDAVVCGGGSGGSSGDGDGIIMNMTIMITLCDYYMFKCLKINSNNLLNKKDNDILYIIFNYSYY